MVYTRSSKRNILKIIENLESQNIQLQKENGFLDKKNRVLEEEKIKLIDKYEPTTTKGAVNLILDLIPIIDHSYYQRYNSSIRDVISNLYYFIKLELCSDYYAASSIEVNTPLLQKVIELENNLENEHKQKRAREWKLKCDARRRARENNLHFK